MPYTSKQHRLFEFVAHNPAKAASEGLKIKPSDASKMASEGVKPSGQQYAAALQKK